MIRDLYRKTSSFVKKAVIISMVFIIVINFFVHSITKDVANNRTNTTRTIVETSRNRIYTTINDPKLNKTKEGKASVALYSIFICKMIGEACNKDPHNVANNPDNGYIGSAANLLTIPYAHPAASGVVWAYVQLQHANIMPQAYAAEGIGFSGLAPFMNIWKVFRDISLMILVIVIIVIGFMIMFRAKINPQTVISIENALPRIAIAMLLITFSYAIAGFLIDLMYVVIALIIGLLSNNGAHYSIAQMQDKYLNGNFGDIWDSLFPQGIRIGGDDWFKNFMHDLVPVLGDGIFNLTSIGSAFLSILPSVLKDFIQFLAYIATFFGAEKILNISAQGGSNILDNISLFAESVGALPGGAFRLITLVLAFFILPVILLPLLIGILVFFTILMTVFRIFFMLLFTYIRILLLIILGPMFVLFSAIPGRDAFGYWLKTLISELLTFPVVIGVFLVGYLIVQSVGLPDIQTPGFLPNPLASTKTFWMPPFLYGLNQYALIFLVGLGLLFIIPDIVKMSKELLGVKPMPSLFSVGTFFAGATAAIGGGIGLATQFHSIKTTLVGGELGAGLLGEKGHFGKSKPATIGEAAVNVPKTPVSTFDAKFKDPYVKQGG